MGAKKKYKIVTDPKYGYLRLEPLPSAEEVKEYYLKEFYSSGYPQLNDSSLKVQKEERDFHASRWEGIFSRCVSYFGKANGLSVLDIGCGYALALMYLMNKGMRVTGVEPSSDGANYARSQGINVIQSGIENLGDLDLGRFDVVLLINVLEHLRFPADTLRSIRTKLLKTKGLLVVDVPNEFNDFQMIANKEFKLKEWWVCPPAHINYFSTESLKRLLVRCGYRIFDYEASFPLEIFMLMGQVYVGNPLLGKECHNRRVKFEYLMRKHKKDKKLRMFYKALADLGLGRQTVMFATKH